MPLDMRFAAIRQWYQAFGIEAGRTMWFYFHLIEFIDFCHRMWLIIILLSRAILCDDDGGGGTEFSLFLWCVPLVLWAQLHADSRARTEK